MKTILKNVLGVALVAVISAGAALGTTSYVMHKNGVYGYNNPADVFDQRMHMTKRMVSLFWVSSSMILMFLAFMSRSEMDRRPS